MRNEKSSFSIVLALGGLLIACGLSQAQVFTGPAGSFTNKLSDPTNLVWDITTVGNITHVESEVEDRNGIPQVQVNYVVAIDQDGRGRISGSGTTTVNLIVMDDSGGQESSTFTGDYKVIGSIASSRGVTRGFLNETATGVTSLESAQRRVRSAHRIEFKFNNTSQIADIVLKDSASASGLGGISSRHTESQSLPSVISEDGSWTLTMELSTTAKKIGGSAVVTLDSGRTFAFIVKGAFNSNTEKSRLLLTAADDATRGSSLAVSMEGNVVKTIKGRITGQLIKAAF